MKMDIVATDIKVTRRMKDKVHFHVYDAQGNDFKVAVPVKMFEETIGLDVTINTYTGIIEGLTTELKELRKLSGVSE